MAVGSSAEGKSELRMPNPLRRIGFSWGDQSAAEQKRNVIVGEARIALLVYLAHSMYSQRWCSILEFPYKAEGILPASAGLCLSNSFLRSVIIYFPEDYAAWEKSW